MDNVLLMAAVELLGWAFGGSLGCWLMCRGLERLTRRRSSLAIVLGALSWLVLSSAGIAIYTVIQNASMATRHEQNVGFFVVIAVTWIAVSGCGTVFGAALSARKR